ncbi:MAG: phage holin family protein [Gaiella sp.]
MIRFLVRTAVFLAAAAVGLIVASVFVDGMSIDATGFISVVVVFAVLQAVLQPFLARTANRNAPVLLGGIGLVTTFVALVVTELVTDGLDISGAGDWILATLIVWIATMIATLLLPLILVKAGVEAARERRN